MIRAGCWEFGRYIRSLFFALWGHSRIQISTFLFCKHDFSCDLSYMSYPLSRRLLTAQGPGSSHAYVYSRHDPVSSSAIPRWYDFEQYALHRPPPRYHSPTPASNAPFPPSASSTHPACVSRCSPLAGDHDYYSPSTSSPPSFQTLSKRQPTSWLRIEIREV